MKSTSEQRLVGRIVVLAFLLGLVFSPVVVFAGIRVYNFIQLSSDPLAAHTIHFGWPLDDLQTILVGTFLVLSVTTTDLYLQFLKGPQWRNNRWGFTRFCEYCARIFGFFLMGGGVISLIVDPLNEPPLSSSQALVAITVLALLFPLGVGALSWYLFVRDKRRAAQREQEEEGNVHENRA